MSKSSRLGRGSRSNSTESDDTSQERAIDQGRSSTLTDVSESKCLAPARNEPIPSSPPPSYEHVLEETGMGQSAEAEEEEEGDETPKKEQGKETGVGGGGGSSGAGPGGGIPAKILHKSSKEFYKAMAKQWGITCKMSDHCRCFDCQSHYFDCEYERDEQEKTDGGLGAGTPMFISEVMHGTACVLL